MIAFYDEEEGLPLFFLCVLIFLKSRYELQQDIRELFYTGKSGSMLKKFLQAMLVRKEEKFYIGDGAIVMRDMCVPLNAIAVIQTEAPQVSILGCVIFVVLGIMALITPSDAIRTLGVIFLLCAALMFGVIILLNKTRDYFLRIQLNSGRVITFSSKDYEFIRELMDTLCESIDNREKKVYVDMTEKHIVQNIGEIHKETLHIDNSNSGNSVWGNWYSNIKGSSIINTGDGSPVSDASQDSHTEKTAERNGMTEEEWMRLELFFASRSRELGKEHPGYAACAELEKCSRKHDAGGIRKIMQSVSKAVLKTLLGATVGGAVKEILLKVLKTE